MLAHQQFYLDPRLVQRTKDRLKSRRDPALDEALSIAKRALPMKTYNQYYQTRRDEYAVEKGIFYYVKDVDILMVLDKNKKMIIFQCSNAFQKVLSREIQDRVVDSITKYSVLQPVPLPDGTRHGMHWTDWLQENPQFDYRNPANDLLRIGPQSGVYHFGIHCQVGDTVGQRGVMATQDSSGRIEKFPHVQQELVKLRYSAIGAAEAVHEFFFKLVDRELMEDYQKVAKQASTLGIDFETRRKNQIFSLTAVLLNLLTIEHKDASDWKFGIAALVPMGDYTGADLLLRELGLKIKAPPGTVQIMRGCELRHSTTKWKGIRVVTVSVAHDAIRRWAQRKFEPKSQAPSKRETMQTDSSDSEDLYPSKTKTKQTHKTASKDQAPSKKR